MKLKDNLRFLRKKSGMTQAELAKKMHLKQYNISDYEIGRIEPNVATLIRFAETFGVTLDFLVGRKSKDDKPIADKNGLEADIKNYISTMQIDKHLISINEEIKDLNEVDKKRIVNSVRFLVETYLNDLPEDEE